MTKIINEFDSYYGAYKLKEIENLRETELDVIVKMKQKV